MFVQTSGFWGGVVVGSLGCIAVEAVIIGIVLVIVGVLNKQTNR